MTDEITPTEIAPKSRGRKPLPRDAEGNIIRDPNAPAPAKKTVTAHPVLSFNAGVLEAEGGYKFVETQWTQGETTAESQAQAVADADKAVSEAEAKLTEARDALKVARENVEKAEAAREALNSGVVLASLPNPNEFDPGKALKVYGSDSPNFDALVDYWRATRTTRQAA